VTCTAFSVLLAVIGHRPLVGVLALLAVVSLVDIGLSHSGSEELS
jgi:hypothetical protein